MNKKLYRVVLVLFNILLIIFGDVEVKTNKKNESQISRQRYLKTSSESDTDMNDILSNIGKSSAVRLRRQAGYRYERPPVSFDLPSRGSGSTLPSASKPVQTAYQEPQQSSSVAPLNQEQYYAYPSPVQISTQRPSLGAINPVQVGPQSETQSGAPRGYQPSISINGQSSYPSSQSPSQSSYAYPQPTQSTPNSVTVNSYPKPSFSQQPSSDRPYNYPQPSVPTSSAPVPSSGGSTAGPTYLPPKAGSPKRNPSYSHKRPSSTSRPSFPSVSTPGAPYLPPKTNQLPSPSPPQQKPPNLYAPASNGLQIIVSDIPQQQTSQGPSPPRPAPMYLSPSHTSAAPAQPAPAVQPSVVNSFLIPDSGSFSPTTATSSSTSAAPGSFYVPPSPSPFQRPATATSPAPTPLSTPASSYLPPF